MPYTGTIGNTQLLRSDKWAVLAGLRFALAALVMLTHSTFYIASAALAKEFLHNIVTSAVVAFLVISGYSIGHSVRQRPEGFGWRRVKRIYPTYAVCLAVALAVALMWPKTANLSTPNLIANVFMLDGLTGHHFRIMTISPAWSLHIEVVFYLLAPMLVRVRQPWVWALALASFALFAYGPSRDYPIQNHAWPVLTLAWAWLLGFAVSGSEVVWPLALAPLGYSVAGHGPWAFAVLAVSALLIAYAPRIKVYAPDLLKRLGDVSYPLYLVHSCVFLALFWMGSRNIGLYWLCALTAGCGVLALVEAPRHLRPCFTSRRSSEPELLQAPA